MKKSYCVLTVILLIFLFFTACGAGETPEPTPSPTPTPTPASVLIPEAVEPGEPEGYVPVEMVGEDVITEEERHRRWLVDLEQFSTHLFNTFPKFTFPELAERERNVEMGIAFTAAIDALGAKVPELTDLEIKVEMQRALALFRDGHTLFDAKGNGRDFINTLRYNRYPLLFQWIYDGFYLLHTHRDFAEAINLQLVAVDGMEIERIFAIFDDFWSTENIYHARDIFTRFLMRPDMMNTLGVIDGRDAVFSFANPDGGTVDITVTADYVFFDEAVWSRDWIHGENILHGRAAGALPLTHHYPEVNNWYAVLVEYNLLYIRIHGFWPFDWDFAQTFDDVEATIRDNHIQRVVIDARGNGGGNLEPYSPHFHTIAEIVPAGGLFYLLDFGTFSAAAVAAAELYSLGAILMGSPSGQNTDFYANAFDTGDAPYWTTLRYSGYTFAVPNRFHTLADFGINPPDLILRPHVHIEPTIDDWVNSHDPVLAYILQRH